MTIYSGYLDRIANTYWSCDNLTWDGTKWLSGSAIANFTLTPLAPLLRTLASEVRMLMMLDGVSILKIVNPADHTQSLLGVGNNANAAARSTGFNVLPGLPSQLIVARVINIPTGGLYVDLGGSHSAQILELEVGYNGST